MVGILVVVSSSIQRHGVPTGTFQELRLSLSMISLFCNFMDLEQIVHRDLPVLIYF